MPAESCTCPFPTQVDFADWVFEKRDDRFQYLCLMSSGPAFGHRQEFEGFKGGIQAMKWHKPIRQKIRDSR